MRPRMLPPHDQSIMLEKLHQTGGELRTVYGRSWPTAAGGSPRLITCTGARTVDGAGHRRGRVAALVPNPVSLAATAALLVSVQVQVRGIEEPLPSPIHGAVYAAYTARSTGSCPAWVVSPTDRATRHATIGAGHRQVARHAGRLTAPLLCSPRSSGGRRPAASSWPNSCATLPEARCCTSAASVW